MTPAPLSFTFRQRRAILISGGLDSFSNHARYLNDLKVFFDCLVNSFKFAPSNIDVLYANGGSHDMGGHLVVTQYCNKANVVAQLQKRTTGMGPLDLLVLFTTNHGRASYPAHELVLWTPGQQINSEEIGIELSAAPDFHFLGIFGECHGQGMFNKLHAKLTPATQQKCVMVASSSGLSWSLGPDDAYDAFLYYLTSAFASKTPSGYPVNADDAVSPDGRISVQEEYNHARGMDKTPDAPDIHDPASIALRMTLDGMLP